MLKTDMRIPTTSPASLWRSEFSVGPDRATAQRSLRLVGLLDAAAERIGRRVGAAAERGGERGGALGRRASVEVPARGRQLRVAHGVLDAHEVDAAGDEQRSEGMAEVMPAERAQPGGATRPLVATAQVLRPGFVAPVLLALALDSRHRDGGEQPECLGQRQLVP